ncbi:MAG: ATP-binding cassette domain-containing protein [Gemmatimonadetes bacterium]|nr:ATP-binding cassette domain-containing protein [Gemmatimonadota bacterium]MYA10296.1 ATP-binding cassette domain-containing protein [Gemmatimonadota bacterium]MYD14764.1 ATP-binding cassette domain-containing protein [Gemmatimonadota bacterium]MYE69245.1 ATP-binding cassette domain-containing protein [Gemmatimonadota bacterium]MYJ68822.1 ATP-binding cassette domain-containing protein [Gemmatimonadota bacterium]
MRPCSREGRRDRGGCGDRGKRGRGDDGARAAGRDAVALIRIEGAVKRYGAAVALDGVSLSVAPGDCLGLVGESGSGKTTLLRAINRLTDLDAGRVLVRGDPVESLDPVRLRRSIGYVQQDGGLIPHWTCLANASLVPGLLGREEAREHGRRALDAAGLDPDTFADRYPRELSGGQRQRVAIARAIAAGPDILLMDEPFGALDAITRREAQKTFIQLRRAGGVTAVFVTHDLAEAMLVATDVAVMRAGRVAFQAPAEELAGSATGYAAELLEKAGVAV